LEDDIELYLSLFYIEVVCSRTTRFDSGHQEIDNNGPHEAAVWKVDSAQPCRAVRASVFMYLDTDTKVKIAAETRFPNTTCNVFGVFGKAFCGVLRTLLEGVPTEES